MNRLLAIDGNSILNRAFYGVRPLTNKNGQRTEAVYGMLNIIFRQLDALSPDAVAVAFDMKAPTFRHNLFDGYKCNRKGMPDDLASQLPVAKKVLAVLGFNVLEKESFEADDILGTISEMDEKEGIQTYILTGDRDSLQLISENTTVLLAGNSETISFDSAKFIEKYGISPDVYVEVKALMGDSSDCIPGVPGIGEKTAFKLISEFGTVDNLYNNIENNNLATGVKTKLISGKDSAYMSRTLSQINRSVPLGITTAELERKTPDRAVLFNLFTELEFLSFIKRLGLESTAEKKEYKEINVAELQALTGEICAAIGSDFIRVCCGVELFECHFQNIAEISGFFTKDRNLSVFDSKSLYHRLAEIGINDFECTFDLMLAAYVLNSSDSEYTITRLSMSYLGETSQDADSDAALIKRLKDVLSARLVSDGAEKLYYEIELPLAKVLAEMEHTGFKVDVKGLSEFSAYLAQKISEYEQQIYDIAGSEFNMNSPKQLGEVLFERLGLPSLKKTKSGYSTNAEVLEKLRPYHPIIQLIFDYRQVAKLRSTYSEGLQRAADGRSRVHTNFKQTGTATGRLSSTEPNLQNIPIRTPLGHEMRKYFIPENGSVLIDADYSQIELRILAHLSGDPTMIEAFSKGIDIHAVTASQVFGVPLEEVTYEMRKRAKAVNFGIVYGIGEFSLSQDIGTTVYQAGQYIKSYFEKYPKIEEYMKSTVKKAKEDGFVTTIFGRRRFIPELSSGKAALRSFGERVAMNSPVQGAAADIIKAAMINTSKALKKAGIDAKLILQVHDELVLEASVKDSEKAAEILKNEMEGAFIAKVPLKVEISTGSNWFENK